MLKPFCGALLSALILVSPASAQTVNDALQTSHYQWDADKLTSLLVRGCGIPRPYFKVEREYDGFARLRESPSVTPDQHKCVTNALQRMSIPIRK